MRDETGRIRELLRRQYPQFADSMITRVPAAILLREDFAQAFRNAYAPRADGSFPTEEEAQARLDSEIDKAIEASLARYRATHPQPDGAPAPLVVESPAS